MNGVRAYGLFRMTGGFVSSLFISILVLGVPTAQAQFSPRALSGYDRAVSAHKGLVQRPAAAQYDVVALRVEFQPDQSLFSTGDGTFEGPLFPDVEGPRVDPLPHDADYFEAHLAFLENYIRRVSDGRTMVSTHLLPVTVRVSGRMAAYAPTGLEADSDSELKKLAGLASEAWTLASHLDSFDMPDGIDPDRTAFVLFHAGVGRDVELLGTTLDKTPEDLPSLYFDKTSMDRLLGPTNVLVDGVPITNTLIIPRTETRRGFDFIQDQPFLAELSINGMLAASFLSYLGVPDLFDTATGQSAVGPFDVMDGLGIFAFNGLLPPEPSAWTKLYLGWADLQTADPMQGDQEVSLVHSGASSGNDVFLVPIAEDEFFLVENRNRDPEADGLHLTIWRDGVYEMLHFENGATDFNSRTISGFPGGVVVDADNLDFALPGGVDEQGGHLIGGMLIWHVDQARLLNGLASNAVNADSRNRAVDLEEADGAQDLGFPRAGLFGPSFDVGSPFDFFYEGNPTVVITPTGSEIRLYENRFGPDTHPGSAANAGGSSFVELSDFSAPGTEMSLVYRRLAEEGVTPRDDQSFVFVDGPASFREGGSLYLVGGAAVDVAAFGFSGGGDGVGGDTAELFWSREGVVVGELDGLFPAVPVQTQDGITVFGPAGFYTLSSDGLVIQSGALPQGLTVVRTTTPLVALSNGAVLVGAEDQEGSILLSAYAGDVTVTRLGDPLLSLAAVDGFHTVLVSSERAEIPTRDRTWSYGAIQSQEGVQAVFSRYGERISGVIPDPEGGRILLLNDDGSIHALHVSDYAALGVEGVPARYAVIADLDSDARPDVLFSIGRSFLAVNTEGAMLEGFPIPMRERSDVQPLVLRLHPEERPIILSAAVDGRLDAYDLGIRTHRVPGFPLPVAAGFAGTPVLSGSSLATLSVGGSVARWDLEAVDEIFWGREGGEMNQGFIEIADGSDDIVDPSTERLLVPDETYNWPNPITEGITWIRFVPNARSDVEITIVDLAGQLIDRLEVRGAAGGVATEVPWRTTSGSGVYLARIQATSESGVTDTRLVKMAIVR